jgi:hypothetical protein
MSQQPEGNDNLLNFIASTVETIRDRVTAMETNMATKEDLSRLVTKEEFEPVREQVEFIGGELESVRDRMATKEDLARVEARLTDKIEVETTVLRGDIEQVHLRLDGIDKALTARLNQLETEMSRLRSVVYLLVKDRPDMLRLLGQAPPTGG